MEKFNLSIKDAHINCDTLEIEVISREDVSVVIMKVHEFCKKNNTNEVIEFKVVTVASEIATNIARYGDSGKLYFSAYKLRNDKYIEVYAEDYGLGISNIEEAMTEGFTTTQNSLGLGLCTVKRLMDNFNIESVPNEGVRILASKEYS